MTDLWKQFQRDLRASWKKTAALVVLFLFGCCFWVPMMFSATKSKKAKTSSVSQAKSSSASTSNPISSETAPLTTERFWKSLSESLATDPLFQPADLSRVSRDLFSVDRAFEPLPVLFAEEQVVVAAKPRKEDVIAAPTGLELKSTVVGRTRRIAMINGRIYQVGRSVLANGQQFRVASIEPNSVVLTAGEQSFELKLAKPQLTDFVVSDEQIVDGDN